MNAHLARVLRRLESVAPLVGLAETLSGPDLQTLLLEVYRRRALRREPRDVAAQYAEHRFVRPAAVGARELHAFDGLALQVLPPEFDAIELAPTSPLGACSVLADVNQDLAVSTIRGVEVNSDPTNVLALEAAQRRRADPGAPVHLAVSHRVLRPQQFDFPGAWAHFRLFAIASAGRGAADHAFEVATMLQHVTYWLALLEASRALGYDFRDVRVMITPLAKSAEVLAEQLAVTVRERHASVDCRVDVERTAGRAYYRTLCLQVRVRGRDDSDWFVADGGFADWTAKLLGDRKERLLVSAFGTERYCAHLRRGGS
ncbi:MAG: hypothetical protein AAF628_07350 [Planctomycetota bacterium]